MSRPRSETRGHALLTAWLQTRAGGRMSASGRVHWDDIRAFRDELNAANDGSATEIRSAFTLYDWLAGSRNPTCPRRAWRPVIERLSRGLVPVAAWGDTLVESARMGA